MSKSLSNETISILVFIDNRGFIDSIPSFLLAKHYQMKRDDHKLKKLVVWKK
jgi:hypothetical protein